MLVLLQDELEGIHVGLGKGICTLDSSSQAARRPRAYKQRETGGVSQSGSLYFLVLTDQHFSPGSKLPSTSSSVLFSRWFMCQILHSVAWCFS